LEGTNVFVSAVHPGGIKTSIARRSRLGKDTPKEWKEQGANFFDKVARTSPETAAEEIVRGIKSRNPRILICPDARGIDLIARLFPIKYLKVIERLSGHKMSLREKIH
jgi:short-subunit dehydrogenase